MSEYFDQKFLDEVTSWRHELHKYPETAFEEFKTADFISNKLESFGLKVHRGLAKTGVVATLNPDSTNEAIGLRADMDALPMCEETCHDYISQNENKMHACGHDGHMVMLLGAAKILSEDKSFKGKVYFIFQPAEENVAGGKVMIDDGLFKLFPCKEIYGMHNWPGLKVGEIALKPGPIMASNDVFEIILKGASGHAAMPHLSDHTISATCTLVNSLNLLVSRVQDAQKPTVLSVTKIEAGSAHNVLPAQSVIWGTVRAFDKESQNLIEDSMKKLIESTCLEYGLQSEFKYERKYLATINHLEQTNFAKEVVKKVTKKDAVHLDSSMASEDFAFMLDEKPGCFVWLGNGEDSESLHNTKYDFNDNVISYGINYWIELSKSFFK